MGCGKGHKTKTNASGLEVRKMWVEAERLGVGWQAAGREVRKGRGIQNGEEMTNLFRAASVLMVPRRLVFSESCIF